MTVADSHDSPTNETKACRKGESRACIMHIFGGIAMLAVGVALLIVT